MRKESGHTTTAATRGSARDNSADRDLCGSNGYWSLRSQDGRQPATFFHQIKGNGLRGQA
jgi:hypothetical protein